MRHIFIIFNLWPFENILTTMLVLNAEICAVVTSLSKFKLLISTMIVEHFVPNTTSRFT